jgi:chromosome segregation and condensation protein ScpB
MLYETTEEFLRSFGFKSVKDLPIIELENLPLEELDAIKSGLEEGETPDGKRLTQQ